MLKVQCWVTQNQESEVCSCMAVVRYVWGINLQKNNKLYTQHNVRNLGEKNKVSCKWQNKRSATTGVLCGGICVPWQPGVRMVNISTGRALRTKLTRHRRHQLRHDHHYHHHNYHTEGLGSACLNVCGVYGGVSFYSEHFGFSRPVAIPPLLHTCITSVSVT